MKKFKSKKVLMIAAIILVFTATAGITMAFFSDYEHAVGKATFTLGGQTEIHESVKDTEKTIVIHNKGEGDVLVRLSIFGPKPDGDKPGVTVKPGEHWSFNKNDGFWYYQAVLPAGEDTTPIIASIEGIPVSADLSEFDVIVVHESQPVVYDKAGNAVLQWKGAN